MAVRCVELSSTHSSCYYCTVDPVTPQKRSLINDAFLLPNAIHVYGHLPIFYCPKHVLDGAQRVNGLYVCINVIIVITIKLLLLCAHANS